MKISFEFDYPKDMPWLLPLVHEEIGTTLKRAAEGMRAAIGRQYVLADAMATGKTFQSFQVGEVEIEGDRMEIELAPQGDRARIAAYIEFGRGPNASGNPSPEMLENVTSWAVSKGIISGKGGSEDKALAWAIAATIAREGFEGRFPVEKAHRAYSPRIDQMMEAAARRLAKKINARLGSSDGIA